MRKKFLFILLVIFPFQFSYCNIDTIKVGNIDFKKDTLNLTEAKAYKMLYENQIKSNDAILKTIYYALGGLATAIIVVFGSNWWFNDKKVRDVLKDNEKQIENLKKEIISDMVDRNSTFSTKTISEINQTQKKQEMLIHEKLDELTKTLIVFSEKIRLESKEDIRGLQNNYQEQLKLFSETFNQQNSALQKNFEERIGGLNKSILEISNAQDKAIERINDKNDYKLQSLKESFLEMNAELWLLRGVPANTVRNYVELALLHVEKGDGFWINRSLRNVVESLERLVSISTILKQDVNNLINKIPEEYNELKTLINNNLQNLPLSI